MNNLVVINNSVSDGEIGPYRLLGALGRGGMAEVWKAEHRHLGQIRALKVLLPEIAARADLVGRLITEARATAWLRHPVIVEVFDCDVLADGTAFIAMEYLQGEPLRAWLTRVDKLAQHPRLAAAIVGRAAEGLAFAHDLGVVHRDLKPENLFLVPLPSDRPAFAVKLLDFGIAKLLCEESRARTRPGCVIGTPDYMAPEQWQLGHLVDHRSDIYALGCLLFELLAGHPPFICSDDIAIMRAHLELPPPVITELEPDVPAALADLLSAMLAKRPEDRPQTMAAVIAALESFLGLERPRFAELLRAPAGLTVEVSDPAAPLATRRGLRDEPRPAYRRPVALPTVAAPGGEKRGLRRRRLALAASLAAVGVGAAAVTGVWLVREGVAARKDAQVARPPETAVARAVAPAAVPAPAAAPASLSVAIESRPAGAEVWVDGEAQARGRTPLDLVFASAGPKTIRLLAAGFRPHTMVVLPGAHTSRRAVLARQQPAAPVRERGPDRAVPPPYQPVGD